MDEERLARLREIARRFRLNEDAVQALLEVEDVEATRPRRLAARMGIDDATLQRALRELQEREGDDG